MGSRRRKPRMLEPIVLQTTQLARDGRAEAERDGRPVIIEGALAVESVRVQLTGRARGRDEGHVLEVLEASENRIEARCSHAALCGGCTLQHMDPVAALAHKQALLLSDLEAAGVIPGEVLAPLTGPTFGYRRRARVGAKWVEKKGKVLVGFREKDKRFVADLDRCDVLAGDAGQLIRPIGELIETLVIRERVPQVEITVSDDVTALVFRVLEEPGAEDLDRLRAFAAASRVRVYLQPGNLESIYALDGDDPHLRYRLAGHDLELAFLPTDFLQVNGPLNERMIDLALELLQVRPDDRVLDLFCGLGNFTLPLARHAREVVGVEGDKGLVSRATQNAKHNGVENAQFRCADLYVDPASAQVWGEHWDTVVLDPPRSGADQILALLAELAPRRIIYVSCGPASFVRDAARLVADLGFNLVRLGVMDMFPQTMHVETIAVFEPSVAP